MHIAYQQGERYNMIACLATAGAAPPKEQYEPPENAEPGKHPEVAVPGEEPEVQSHQSQNGTGQQHAMSNSRALF